MLPIPKAPQSTIMIVNEERMKESFGMDALYKDNFFSSVVQQRRTVQQMLYGIALFFVIDISCLLLCEYRPYALMRVIVLYLIDRRAPMQYVTLACIGDLVCAWCSHQVVLYEALSIIMMTLLTGCLRAHMVTTRFAATVRLCSMICLWHIGMSFLIAYTQSMTTLLIDSMVYSVIVNIFIQWCT